MDTRVGVQIGLKVQWAHKQGGDARCTIRKLCGLARQDVKGTSFFYSCQLQEVSMTVVPRQTRQKDTSAVSQFRGS